MSRRNITLTGIVFLLLGYFVLSSRSAGVAAENSLDATGSPFSQVQCNACHTGTTNLGTSAILEILDGTTPVTSYVPGNTYTMTLQVSGNASFYGGQAVALAANDNANAGLMGTPITTETQVTTLGTRSYLEQSAKSTTGTFSVPWTAPSEGTGDVNIYYIGNGVDGIGTSGDDPTVAMSLTITEMPSASCTDGILNQDELGIDCGGSNCSPCTNIYVDAMATGSNDGYTWENAFTNLQDALAVGTNKTIHIAKGTYKPTTMGKGISFEIPDAAILLGGYSNGGEDRDIANNPTILSGDIDNDGTLVGNSFHVVKVVNANNVVLDGIIIQEGNATVTTSFGRSRGAGLFVNNSTLTLSDTEVRMNKAIYGGGLFATLSPTVNIEYSTFKQNESEYGSALYHSNMTQMYIRSSRIIDNNSTYRCAVEINNSLYTLIENTIIANNASTNANAVGFIATNRDQTCDIYNSTILGETLNKSLISLQIGFNDVLDVNIYNTIVAHQNPSFDKSLVIFNNGILNLNTENCYIQGSSIIGTSANNLYSDIDGDLLLNANYSVDNCSPVVDAGNDLNTNQLTTDIDENPRIVGTVDIGAYEVQGVCFGLKETNQENLGNNIFNIYPNPTSNYIQVETDLEEFDIHIYNVKGELILNTKSKKMMVNHLPSGIYIMKLLSHNQVINSEKIMIQ